MAHPLTRSKDLDDPNTTALRLQIIRSKPLLRKIYEEWYERISSNFKENDCVLELGSGAGFMKDFMPNLITSELFPTPGVSCVIDAQAMNLDDVSLDGIVSINSNGSFLKFVFFNHLFKLPGPPL